MLCEPGEPVSKVFFLYGGMASKLVVLEDGTEIECALIGREGAVGVTSAFTMKTSVTRDICHFDTEAAWISAAALRNAARDSPRIAEAMGRYNAWKLGCITRSGACSACHSVEQRLARCILRCSDVIERREIPLPQEVFAKMMAVQRTTVNPILQRFRSDGLIELRRGALVVRDRRQLTARACQCYATLRLLQDAVTAPLAGAAAGH